MRGPAPQAEPELFAGATGGAREGNASSEPVSTFAEQADAGLTSSTFDIEANIRDGDSRAGLDERGTQEVLDIMRRERVK